MTVLTAPFALTATASSGLAVSFASATVPVCTVSGTTVTILAVGICSITASQAGNANYAPAIPVTNSVVVTQVSQTIAFGPLGNVAFGAAPFALSATASSGLPVAFASNTTPVCAVSGTTVTILTVGTCSIAATQPANANYSAAPPVTQTFTVAAAAQSITFGPLSNVVFGAPPFPVAATASSGLPVGFASTTPGVCTVSATTVTIVAGGTCSITAAQPGNANIAAANPVVRSFTVTQAAQSISFGAPGNVTLGVSPFGLNALASSGPAVGFSSFATPVCTVSGTTVTLVSVGTCTIQAMQTGNSNYLPAATVTQSFTVLALKPSEVGIFRQNFEWLLDANGNRQYDGPGTGQDLYYVNFVPSQTGDIPVVGDWSGSGTTKIGIYHSSTGQWFLDYNGNGVFDAGDKTYNFGGIAGDKPVVGDWSGSGTSKIGIFRFGYFWLLDYNGDGTLDGGDQAFAFGGIAGDVPVAGDWTGNGIAKVGVVRAFFPGGTPALWILDSNNDHSIDAGDLVFAFGGIAGDVPVVGDWNGTGFAKAGMFRQGFSWAIDNNGSAPTVLGGSQVVMFGFGGIPGDIPVVGKW